MSTDESPDALAVGMRAALVRADRHCDLEGLPQPSVAAIALDKKLMDGAVTADEAVRILADAHRDSRTASSAKL